MLHSVVKLQLLHDYKMQVVTLKVKRLRLAEALRPFLCEIEKNRLLKSFLSSHPAVLEVGLVEISENYLSLFSPYSKDVRDLLSKMDKEKNKEEKYISRLKTIARLLYHHYLPHHTHHKEPFVTSKVISFKFKEREKIKDYPVDIMQFSMPLGMVEVHAYPPFEKKLIVRALLEESYSLDAPEFKKERSRYLNKLKTILVDKGLIEEDLTPLVPLDTLKRVLSFPPGIKPKGFCIFCGRPVYGKGKYCSGTCRTNFWRYKEKIKNIKKQNPNLSLDEIASKIRHKKIKDKRQFVRKILKGGR